MKNIYLYFFALIASSMMMNSCASVKNNKKTLCECMEIAIKNPKITSAPEGCEWMDAISEEEGTSLIKKMKEECPEIYKSLFIKESKIPENRAIEKKEIQTENQK
ncbi:MAG: hypothetical protein P8I93_01780 [Crocinitomicaceae bacterium]|nr:hypothetical protein [Crocinitomicaceae bacterium]